MSEPFLGEIKMVGFNFAPRGYALCNGQLLSIAQNSALFALLGTTYGGNGQTTFALPNLQSRVPMHFGQGPGLSSRVMGEQAGTENVTLLSTQMPQHNHLVNASTGDSSSKNPSGGVMGGTASPIYATGSPNAQMNPVTIGFAGGNQPHENMPPFLVVNFIIALQGIFPSRN
ncbi:phage tail protein [Iamia sp. SCSIO 61187]|uniref:phage tail protein n=1 Tax=Iamia sp. SCSIO 61187 TaxID=2722752 RepID=UPI001C635C5E|nr:tail fiber protein [Iamia sp. SCSIO 61187]QYG91873.1 phage tail protein [Iamia sp. SCSIO 61187]